MEQSVLLNSIDKIEKGLHLNDETILGIPLWRLFRFDVRVHYINTQVDYKVLTAKAQGTERKKPRFFSGFWHYLWRKRTTIIFPFTRLANNNGVLLDKFTDPIIELCSIDSSKYLIVDPSDYYGDYNRLHKDSVISNEGRTLSRYIARILLAQAFIFLKPKKLTSLFNRIREPFKLSDNYIYKMYKRLGFFIADYFYFLIWFMILRPRRVFVVYREAYFPVIAACKKLSIPIAEFQHGITLDKTVSFTGDYDYRIDPDYFFVFGNFWKDSPFEMPKDRIIPIGWAYSKYIESRAGHEERHPDKTILVISSAEISEQILDAIAYLSNIDSEVSFHIRLHPCEGYDEFLQKKLSKISNAEVVSNKEDSALVLPRYRKVIGENSSVLYEALANGCKVGMLAICGLQAPIYVKGIKESFYIIDSKEAYMKFMQKENSKNSESAFYTDFDQDFFIKFIEERM